MKGKYLKIISILLILLSLTFLYGYQKIINKGPYSIHKWRQADCLSITLNYYKENLNFFTPSIHWIGSNGNGKTISEFPIIYYTVAQLWKIFGHKEIIFRLLNILIVFIGLFHLFKIFENLLNDIFWSISGVIFLFTSSILVYYTNNFLMDAPAFACALIALYYYLKFYQEGQRKYLFISILFFTLGGLLKISSLLSFIAIAILHTYHVLYLKQKGKQFNWGSLIPFAVLVLIVFCWYYYTGYYNKHNTSGIFLQGLLSIWDCDKNSISGIFKLFRTNILPSFFNKYVIYFLILLLPLNFFFRKSSRYLNVLSILVLIGVIGFFFLFYQVFNVHDYYLINSLIVIPVIFLTVLYSLRNSYPSVYKSRILKTSFAFLLVFLVYQTTVKNRIRYTVDDVFVHRSFLINEAEMNKWKGYHAYYDEHFKAMETIQPYLRNMGIERTDCVISIPDGSINISLYLLDQKGFTDFGYSSLLGKEKIEKQIDLGAKYLIINDKMIYENEFIKPFITKKMGSYLNIDIYDLRDYQREMHIILGD